LRLCGFLEHVDPDEKVPAKMLDWLNAEAARRGEYALTDSGRAALTAIYEDAGLK
jgi:hypothetical protein